MLISSRHITLHMREINPRMIIIPPNKKNNILQEIVTEKIFIKIIVKSQKEGMQEATHVL